ncbi:hypothetical protein D3C73_1372030 [compost metagenome]
MVSGNTTRRNVVQPEAPRSRAASTSDRLSSSRALKIGIIMNGIKIYTDTNTKLKPVKRICCSPSPSRSKKLFTGPNLPKIPMNAYVFSSRLIQVGRIISSSHSCLCLVRVSR